MKDMFFTFFVLFLFGITFVFVSSFLTFILKELKRKFFDISVDEENDFVEHIKKY